MAPSSASTPTTKPEIRMTPEDLGFTLTSSNNDPHPEGDITYGRYDKRTGSSDRQFIVIIHRPEITPSTQSAYGVSEEQPWRLAFYGRAGKAGVIEAVGPTAESMCLAYVAAKLRGEVDE